MSSTNQLSLTQSPAPQEYWGICKVHHYFLQGNFGAEGNVFPRQFCSKAPEPRNNNIKGAFEDAETFILSILDGRWGRL